jgi:hypothetical protein
VGLTWLHWAHWLPAALWLAKEIHMGYKRKPRQYRLKFADEDMEGFECLCKSVTVDQFVGMSQQAAGIAVGEVSGVESMFELLTDSIISWNLEEDDDTPVPVAWAICRESRKPGEPGKPCPDHKPEDPGDPGKPCDYTGLCAQDIEFTMAILMGWMNAIASVPPPLQGGLSNGGIPQEVSAQLASLSQSLPNSPKPG